MKAIPAIVGRFFLLAASAAAILRLDAPKAQGGVYYASPDGNGNGKSESSPFRVAAYWKIARPGDTLWLLDGTYKGADSMITPPASASGRKDQPLRIAARHEGKVLVTGEGARRPVFLRDNEYVTIEGINACCSNLDVVYLSGTSDVTLRRVVAWDAGVDQNAMVFSIAYGKNTLLEDTAGFGAGRKIYQYFQTDGPATIRRAFGEWNRSINSGPKMTFSLAYSSRHLTVENAIGTFRSMMPASYTLMDNGKPIKDGAYNSYMRRSRSCGPGLRQDDGSCRIEGGRIEQMYGVLVANSNFHGAPNRRVGSAYLGSLAFTAPGVPTDGLPRLVMVSEIEGVMLQDVAAVWGSNPDNKDAMLLANCNSKETPACDAEGQELVARNLLAVGGPIHFASKPEWSSTAVATKKALDEVSNNESLYRRSDGGGANLCYRYVDGQLTSEPLWPWPMDARIREASELAGRQPIEVTKSIRELLGPIPAPCLAGTEAR